MKTVSLVSRLALCLALTQLGSALMALEVTSGLADHQVLQRGTDGTASATLNGRPRQTLEFETPAERFSACVASTG